MIKAAAAVSKALLEAAQQGLAGGSTAVFALLDDSQVLLGHLGDSKAVLCHLPTSGAEPAAHRHQQHTEAAAHPRVQHNLQAAALTVDHSPDRPDELARITAAGGFVSRATAGSVTPFSGLSHLGKPSALPTFHCHQQYVHLSASETLQHVLLQWVWGTLSHCICHQGTLFCVTISGPCDRNCTFG